MGGWVRGALAVANCQFDGGDEEAAVAQIDHTGGVSPGLDS